MPDPVVLIERAVTHHADVADTPPTMAVVATDVFARLAVNAAELNPHMELPPGLLRVAGIDVELGEHLPAGRVEVQ